jgi:hypothetical protein
LIYAPTARAHREAWTAWWSPGEVQL